MTMITQRPCTIGIIGGRGQFGSWLSAICYSQGLPILLSDLGTEASNREVARRADIIFITVPIGVTKEVLEEIESELCAEKLVVDLTSVKAPIMSVLSRLRSEVLSLHPMFAPSVPSVVGQTCVTCRVRTGRYADFVEGLLRDAGLKLVPMDADEHDKVMAVIQGLTHFQALTAAHCMMQMGFDPTTTVSVSSPVYRLRLAMIGRVLGQDPRLYAEIQVYNPYIPQVLEQLHDSAELFGDAVRRSDVESLVAEIQKVREAFAGFTEQAMRDSTAIIARLPRD